MTPSLPVRAHHRIVKNILATHFPDKKADPTPAQIDLVSRVFTQAGGSWERVFKGGSADFELLRTTLKVALKQGYISRASQWGA